MSENTDHPTQKPEKLVAKIILASSKPNDVVFDPFLGSGTTSVVAHKLGRRYVGIDIDEPYCCLVISFNTHIIPEYEPSRLIRDVLRKYTVDAFTEGRRENQIYQRF